MSDETLTPLQTLHLALSDRVNVAGTQNVVLSVTGMLTWLLFEAAQEWPDDPITRIDAEGNTDLLGSLALTTQTQHLTIVWRITPTEMLVSVGRVVDTSTDSLDPETVARLLSQPTDSGNHYLDGRPVVLN